VSLSLRFMVLLQHFLCLRGRSCYSELVMVLVFVPTSAAHRLSALRHPSLIGPSVLVSNRLQSLIDLLLGERPEGGLSALLAIKSGPTDDAHLQLSLLEVDR